MPATTKTVKVYSVPTCPYCTMLKEFLKSNSIPFEDIDVGVNAQAADEMINKSGQMGVPVVDIGGTIIVGFDREVLSKELGITK